MAEQGFYTVHETAIELNVCDDTIYRYLAAGYLTSQRINPRGPHRIPKKQVDKKKNGSAENGQSQEQKQGKNSSAKRCPTTSIDRNQGSNKRRR